MIDGLLQLSMILSHADGERGRIEVDEIPIVRARNLYKILKTILLPEYFPR